MDLSVAECARQRGVSRQRVLSMIHAEQIEARRVGRSWVINQSEVNNRAALGRPLSARMAQMVVRVISGLPLTQLSPQDRFFAKGYIERLRAAENPAQLLHSWMKSRQLGVVRLAANRADLAELGSDARVVASGITDERSGLSATHEFEGYVATTDLDAIRNDYLLVASDSPNVLLHMVEVLPDRPIPLGLVLADLADWNRPREDGRVIELVRGIGGAARPSGDDS